MIEIEVRREHSTEKTSSEQRLEGGEGVSLLDVWGTASGKREQPVQRQCSGLVGCEPQEWGCEFQEMRSQRWCPEGLKVPRKDRDFPSQSLGNVAIICRPHGKGTLPFRETWAAPKLSQTQDWLSFLHCAWAVSTSLPSVLARGVADSWHCRPRWPHWIRLGSKVMSFSTFAVKKILSGR